MKKFSVKRSVSDCQLKLCNFLEQNFGFFTGDSPSAFGRQNNMNKVCGFDFVDLTCN